MRIILTSPFQVTKAGNSEGEGEDRVQLPKNLKREKKTFRFAVADGATESAFSWLWAQTLVETYVITDQRKAITPTELLKKIQEKAPQWSKEVWAKPLPWFAQEKVQHGAFSTLLGLYLADGQTSSHDGGWSAIGVGDTCVFQIRKDELITTFPVERAEQFGNRPILISTNPASNLILYEQAHRLEKRGLWQAGDRFLLMTDALAHWFLDQVEEGRKPWANELVEDAFAFSGQFESWIGELRAEKNIRNDDVTLLMIRVE